LCDQWLLYQSDNVDLLQDVHVSIVTRGTETVHGVHEVLIIIPYCDVRGCTVSDPDLYLDVVSSLFSFSPIRSFPSLVWYLYPNPSRP
jgi:hypothetical protein